MPWKPPKRQVSTPRPKSEPREWSKLYDLRAWRRASVAFLAENPLCCECEAAGIITASFAVDHIRPHRGCLDLFWDESNWQPLCQSHHNAKSAKERLS